jgi:transposase, IS30 family
VRPITEEEKKRILDMHQAGVTVKRIARIMGRQNCSMRELISRSGEIRPPARVLDERHLSLAARKEISRSLAAGCPSEPLLK